MDDSKKKSIEEIELFMQEVYSDPDVANAEPPTELHDKVFAEIHARELAKREQEVIRLEKVYRKRLRFQKYVAVAAVMVLVLAFGVTSMGGPEKMVESIKYAFTGHEQVVIDSKHEDVAPITTMDEEETFQEIQKKFGFTPVSLDYLPENVGFVEAEFYEEIQSINIIYGKRDDAKIVYAIRPNYRVGSFGKDVEDDFIEEYIEENESAIIYVRKYLVDEKEERWSVQFEYKGVLYTMTIMDSSKGEVEKIVKNLFFS